MKVILLFLSHPPVYGEFFCSFSHSATALCDTLFGGRDAASPVCVTSHIRERSGEVDEPGEAVDEVDAHKGILNGMDSSEHRS